MKKTVLYLRYSSDKQTEQSIEGQDRVCREYCQRNDLQIVHSYIDRALSASKNVEKREQFLKMIEDSEKGEFEAVVVYKLDRFSRNRYDSAIFKNKLKKNGVAVFSATENLSDSPESVILESVLEGMAEFYSRELAQKVTRGMNETALKANSCGGTIPLGYRVENKKLVINPITAPIVREAFDRYASGEEICSITEDFRAKGYRTSRGAKFNRNSFYTMLTNVKYIGIYRYKDIRIEGGVPAIVEKEVFDRVQTRLERRKKAPGAGKAKEKYLLSGKLFCGHCGEPMRGESGKSHMGTAYRYYSCRGRKESRSCEKKPLRKEYIEDLVIDDVLTLLQSDQIEQIASCAVKAAKREADQNETIPALKKGIKETEKRFKNLFRMVEMGSDSPTLFERLSELEAEKAALELQLREEQLAVPNVTKTEVIAFLSQFARGDRNDPKYREKLVDMLVNSVTVWDEPDGDLKITVLFNTTAQATKTVKGSDLNSLVHQTCIGRTPTSLAAASPSMFRSDTNRKTPS